MISAGIDIGAKFVKVVICNDGKVIGRGKAATGFDQQAAAEEALSVATRAAGVKVDEIKAFAATGAGREFMPYEGAGITEVGAAAAGAAALFPTARTVIDVGAEDGRAIKCDGAGKVLEFVVNERCAAGAGSFTEAMARALEIKVEEIGALSLSSTKSIPLNTQCVVFAESEVVSLTHQRTPKEDIARAVHDAVARRISSLVRKIGIENDVVLIGGLARNVGFVASLKEALETNVSIPEEPDFVSALGAAVKAASAEARER